MTAVGAVLAAVGALATLAAKSSQDPAHALGSRLITVAAPPTWTTGRVRPVSVPVLSPFAFDQFGFIGSGARCEDAQTARAIGRTQRSLVVICLDRAGRLEYHGVRMSDDAALAAAAEMAQSRRFVARNLGVNYAVSPTELLVTAGSTVIKREPMIEYREMLSAPVVVAPR